MSKATQACLSGVPKSGTRKRLDRWAHFTITDLPLPSGATISTIEQVPSGISDGAAGADPVIASVDDFISAVEADILELKVQSEKKEDEINSPPINDPVRIATGSNYIAETDLEIPFHDLPFHVRRVYQSNSFGDRSFGKGWAFSLDSCIVWGVRPDSEAETAKLERSIEELTGIYNDIHSQYQTSLVTIDEEYLPQARASQTTVNDTIAGLEAVITPSLPEAALTRLNQDLDHARQKKIEIDAAVNRLEDARTELVSRYNEVIMPLSAEIQSLTDTLSQKRNESGYTDAGAERNRFTITGSEPAYVFATGIGTVTLIDEEGTPRLFIAQTAPRYDSWTWYADGTRNYYPSGSEFVPAAHSSMRLTLLPDGRFVRQDKDGTRYTYRLDGQLGSISDTNGNELTLSYDDDHFMTALADSHGRTVTFERNGPRITAVRDHTGRRYAYEYDALERLVMVTDAALDSIGYGYDGLLLTEIRKPDGSVRKYFYETNADGLSRVTGSQDETGAADSYEYNPGERLTVYTNPSGIVERHFYDERMRTVKIEYQDGTYVSMEYDDRDRLVKRVNQLGEAFRFSYDDDDNLIGSTDPENVTERWTYTSFGKPLSHTDKRGFTTYYSYDTRGNLLSVGFPDGTSLSFTYTPAGLVSSYTDRRGKTTYYSYDAYGYLAAVEYGDGAVERFEHDVVGNLRVQIGPEGATTIYTYNADNKIISVTDTLGYTTSYEYDARKDLVRVVDPRGTTSFEYDGRHLLSTVMNPLEETVLYSYRNDGKLIEKRIGTTATWRYVYDDRGNLERRTQVEAGIEEQFEYDALGRLTARIDGDKHRTEYGYTDSGALEWVRDPAGCLVSYAYDSGDLLTAFTDQRGFITIYRYDEVGRLIETMDPYGHTERYAYDGESNLIEVTDRLGNRRSYSYDERGRLVSAFDEAGNAEVFRYNKDGTVSERIDVRGAQWRYEYDPLGRLVSIKDPLEGVRTFEYDPLGALTASVDETGARVTYELDPLGRVTVERDPYGNPTTYRYDEAGRVISVTDALGHTTNYNYDAAGRLIGRTDPLGNTWRYEYDRRGNLLKEIDPTDQQTLYSYNSRSLLSGLTNGAGDTRGYRYDEAGNLIEEIDGHGNSYYYHYDKLGRLVAETNRLGVSAGYRYDELGRLTEKTDFTGAVTRYSYDPLGRLLRVELPEGTVKEYGYDEAGAVTLARNGEREYRYIYDPAGRLIASLDLTVGEKITYGYDAAGRRTSLSWLDGTRTTRYGYGKRGELVSLVDPLERTTAFCYDELGREVERRDPNGVVTTTSYDEAGRVIALKRWDAAGPYGWWASRPKSLLSEAYRYDEAGRCTAVVDNHGALVRYEYDEAGRLSRVQYPFAGGKKLVDFIERLDLGLYPEWEQTEEEEPEYGPRGWGRYWVRGKSHWALPHFTAPGYDEQSFAEELERVLSEREELYARIRGWDEDERRQGRFRLEQARGAHGWGYERDWWRENLELYGMWARVRENWWESFSPLQYVWEERFAYDRNGNRSEKITGWGEIRYRYDAEDRLLQAGERHYAYDEAGTTVSESLGAESVRYRYDGEGRLTEALSRTTGMFGFGDEELGVRYGYDAFGRRVSRTPYMESGGRSVLGGAVKRSEYLYDGLSFQVLADLMILEANPAETAGLQKAPPGHEGRGSVLGESRLLGAELRLVSEYQWASGVLVSRADFSAAGALRFDRRPSPSVVKHYHSDVRGSVVQISDWKGAEIERYRYDAFGSVYEGRFGRANEFGYAAKRYERGLGGYDYGFRDYRPALGRWLTPDPIRDGLNWYVYCNDDPINRIDPWGLEDIVVMYLLNQEEKNLNAFAYNLLVDQTPTEIRKAAESQGKTFSFNTYATEADIRAAYEDADTERLIIVAHGYQGEARLSNIDNKTNPGLSSTITPSSFDPSKKGAELTTVDIVACYQNTTSTTPRVNLEADWEASVGTNVNTYNPNGEPIHWNQTNYVLQDQIPADIRGTAPSGPMPEPNPVTSWLQDVVGSGGTGGADVCGK